MLKKFILNPQAVFCNEFFKKFLSVNLCIIITSFIFTISSQSVLSQTIPPLGAAKSFAALAGTTITATPSSVLSGNVGVSPGSSVTGFPPAVVQNGYIYTGVASLAGPAKNSALNAYNNLKGQAYLPANDLSGLVLGETAGAISLSPGVYNFSSSAQLNSTLTLNDGGDSNAIFIFQIGTTLTTASGSRVIMSSGARGVNVYWQIGSSATIGTYTKFKGNIIANTSITFTTGAGTTGRVFALNGAVTIDACEIDALPIRTWTGAAGTSDWFTPANWYGDVPDGTLGTLIPGTILSGRFFPIVNAGIAMVETITIQNGATVNIANSKLQIKEGITNNGIINASNGTIEMNGVFPQTISANTFENNSILNLIIGNNVTLAGEQNITGSLSFGSSNNTLYTGGQLTLKSTAIGTAQLADITSNGIVSGNTISGNITIERYIPAKRAWRLLSAPVCSCNAPSINTAWQEGSTSGNPNPGYGTQITGGSTANGFDQGINSNAGIRYYSNVANSLVGLPVSPGTNIDITNYPGYFLFIRGDRSTNMLQGVDAALTPTTLRIKGKVNTGNFAVNINAVNNTLIGNPYPAAVDFHTLTKNNVNDKFYLWDPKMAGSNGVGGYVTLIWNSSTSSYDATSSVSSVSRYIPSGEAFFVESLDGINPGILTFKETDKNNGGSDQLFRPVYGHEKIRINLFAVNADGAASFSDGVLTTYDNNNTNAVDNNDAKKLYNIAENICIGRDSKNLAIERRQTIEDNDTTFLNVYKLKQQNYKLQITTEAMNNSSLYAVLKDNYSESINNTVLNMAGFTDIVFNVNADPASYALNRFSIVFAKQGIVPVTFISVKAYRLQKDITVEWKTANDLNIKEYEVQYSATTTNFTKVATIKTIVNNEGNAAYSWLHANATEGIHHYRIKSIGFSEKENCSSIVKVEINSIGAEKKIVMYSNSIKGNSVTLKLNNIEKGIYNLQLYSMDGQIIEKISLNHAGGSSAQTFTIHHYLAAGKYQVQLSGKSLNFTTWMIKE